MKPQRVSVLLNASAGTAEANCDQLRAELESAFQKHAISADLEFLSGEDLRAGAEGALQRATDGKLDAILVGGGDGTISTVASVVVGSGVPLGIIPLGTLNHFAKDLKIPLAIDEAVTLIAAGETRFVDVGEVNGRTFINNSSIGIYPYSVLVRERQRRAEGLPKWLAMILAGLKALRYFPLRRLSICVSGCVEAHRSPCVFIGNNVYQINGATLGTRDRLDDGELCLYVAKRQSRLGLLWLGCRALLGFLDGQRDLRIYNSSAVEISSHHRRLLVALDGEIEKIRPPLHYRIRSKVLRVFANATPAA